MHRYCSGKKPITDYTDFTDDTDSADVSIQVKGTVTVAVTEAVQVMFLQTLPLSLILKLFLFR